MDRIVWVMRSQHILTICLNCASINFLTYLLRTGHALEKTDPVGRWSVGLLVQGRQFVVRWTCGQGSSDWSPSLHRHASERWWKVRPGCSVRRQSRDHRHTSWRANCRYRTTAISRLQWLQHTVKQHQAQLHYFREVDRLLPSIVHNAKAAIKNNIGLAHKIRIHKLRTMHVQ